MLLSQKEWSWIDILKLITWELHHANLHSAIFDFTFIAHQ